MRRVDRSNICVTDRPTDRPTDKASYRGALAHLTRPDTRPISILLRVGRGSDTNEQGSYVDWRELSCGQARTLIVKIRY